MGKVESNLVSVTIRILTLPWTNSCSWSNLFDIKFIFKFPIISLFTFFTQRIRKKSESFSIIFLLLTTLLLQSMLILCLTSSEESKPCLQLSLPTVVLSSSVSQILLLKLKEFKKQKRLLANVYVPSLFKCKPSLHKTSLVILSLLMNWKFFFCIDHVIRH